MYEIGMYLLKKIIYVIEKKNYKMSKFWILFIFLWWINGFCCNKKGNIISLIFLW